MHAFYVLINLLGVHIGYRVSETNIWASCQNKLFATNRLLV